MKKWLLYTALVILSLSVFSIFFMETSYRKMFFQHEVQEKGNNFLLLNKTYLQLLFKHDIIDTFDKINNIVLNNPKKTNFEIQEEVDAIKKDTKIVDAIVVSDMKKPLSFPKILLPTSNLKQYIVYNVLKNKNVILIINIEKIRNMMNLIYRKEEIKKYFSLPLTLLYIENRILYLNTSFSDIMDNKTVMNQVMTYLQQGKNLKFVLNGQHIFIDKLIFQSPYLKNIQFFLGIKPTSLPFTALDIFFLFIMAFISIAIIVLGHIYISRHYENMKNELSLNHESEESLLEYNHSLLPSKREYKELRTLIHEVTLKEGEYKKVLDDNNDERDLEPPISFTEKIENLKNIMGHSIHWDTIINIFPEIDYTLKCTPKDKIIDIDVIDQYGKRFSFLLDKDLFFLPLFSKKDQAFYIYKEAGRTSAIKKLFSKININPNFIEGILFIPCKVGNQNFFIIHLFSKEIDHITYSNIYRTTKKIS